MGVLFEISIVCHVFVFVVLVGGWGFSLFGGCSGLSAVFSRVRGSSGFSLLLASCGLVVGGWGSGCWGFLGFGVGAPGSCSLWGVGWVRLARPAPAFLCGGWVRVRLVLAPCGGGGWVCLCVWFILGMRFPGVGRAARLFFGGWVCLVSCFVFAVVFVVFAGGFRVFLFPLGASLLWFGGCRVGLGLFFLRLLCSVRVRVGSLLGVGPGSGLGLVLFGEFDPGSGRTLAACLTHASRTGPLFFLGAG